MKERDMLLAFAILFLGLGYHLDWLLVGAGIGTAVHVAIDYWREYRAHSVP